MPTDRLSHDDPPCDTTEAAEIATDDVRDELATGLIAALVGVAIIMGGTLALDWILALQAEAVRW